MAFQISTSIQINSSAQGVWKELIDFKSYPEWNSFITSITGKTEVNSKIKATIDGMKFSPKVLSFDENEKFQWIGRLLFPGVFDGKHTFLIEENGDGTVTFIQKESFKGILVPFLKKKMRTDILSKFKLMNEKLKERVEG